MYYNVQFKCPFHSILGASPELEDPVGHWLCLCLCPVRVMVLSREKRSHRSRRGRGWVESAVSVGGVCSVHVSPVYCLIWLLLAIVECTVPVSVHALQERTEDKEGSKEKRKRDSPPPAAPVKEVESKVGAPG